jgi:hypothetical protein
MARKELVVCDNCGTVKGETNHWWQLYVEHSDPMFTLPQAMLILPSEDMRLPPWNKGERYDLCGDSCISEVTHRVRAGEAAVRNQL